jgi:hypothetical protein
MNGIQISLGIATIVMSGVVSGIVTYQLNSRRDARSLKRQKLEQVYESYAGFVEELGGSWLPYMSVMVGKISYNEALDMNIKGAPEKRNLRSLEMLVSIYFPNMQTHLTQLLHIRDKANEILHRHKLEYQHSGPIRSSAHEEMQRVVRELSNLEELFVEAVRKEAAKINRKIPGAE